jgi:DNA-binding helix-hairpin-helix protein with protein kinase domain
MASWPDGGDVEESSLRLGRELGNGGQGVVRLVIGQPMPLVYKQYKIAGADPAALRNLVELPASLQSSEREQLLQSTAWPLARVMRHGQLSGFLMPEIPDYFRGPNAAGTSKLRELQYLLYPPRPLWGDVVPPGLPFGTRIEVATEFTRILCLLHAKSLVVGDISMSNVLWAPGTPARIFVIDCDGIRKLGSRPVLTQAETPDWDDPQQSASGPDLDTDRYKLALLVARVLCGEPYPRPDGSDLALPAEVPSRIADRVRPLWRQAAGGRGTRPDAAQWLGALMGRAEIPLAPPPPVRGRPAIPMAELEGTRGPRPVIPLRPANGPGTAPRP